MCEEIRTKTEDGQQWSRNDGTNDNEATSTSSESTEQWSKNDGSNDDKPTASQIWKVDAPEFVPKRPNRKSTNAIDEEIKLHQTQAKEAFKKDEKAEKHKKVKYRLY